MSSQLSSTRGLSRLLREELRLTRGSERRGSASRRSAFSLSFWSSAAQQEGPPNVKPSKLTEKVSDLSLREDGGRCRVRSSSLFGKVKMSRFSEFHESVVAFCPWSFSSTFPTIPSFLGKVNCQEKIRRFGVPGET